MGKLALTFDDGPHPLGTPAVLDALHAADARATFFVVAPAAQRYPKLIERILAGGHRIGLHCDVHQRHSDHDRAWGRLDMRRALARLATLGVTPTRWRTPWGDRAAWTDGLAAEAGLELTGWSSDTHDWRGDDAERMLAATEDDLRDGAIVLAHDGIGPGARRSLPCETARYVALAAEVAARRNLVLEPLR